MPGVARPHGAEGNRTPDLLNAIQALSQLSYGPITHTPRRSTPTGGAVTSLFSINCSAGLTRLELATSGVTDRHSNRLSYSPQVPALLPTWVPTLVLQLAAAEAAPPSVLLPDYNC